MTQRFFFHSPNHSYPFSLALSLENDDDTLHNPAELDSSTILNECKKDLNSKRRPSLAQKMTSNLRRLSGAPELKIDMGDPMNANNSKYCNKKIKVNRCVRPALLSHFAIHRMRGEGDYTTKHLMIIFSPSSSCVAWQRHSIHGMMEEENVIRPHQEIQRLSAEERKFLLNVERGDVAGTRRYTFFFMTWTLVATVACLHIFIRYNFFCGQHGENGWWLNNKWS